MGNAHKGDKQTLVEYEFVYASSLMRPESNEYDAIKSPRKANSCIHHDAGNLCDFDLDRLFKIKCSSDTRIIDYLWGKDSADVFWKIRIDVKNWKVVSSIHGSMDYT